MYFKTLSVFQNRVATLAEDYNLVALQPRRSGSSVAQAHLAATRIAEGQRVVHVSATHKDHVVDPFRVLASTYDHTHSPDVLTFRATDIPQGVARFVSAADIDFCRGMCPDVILMDQAQHIPYYVWEKLVAPLLVTEKDPRILLFATGSVEPDDSTVLSAALSTGRFHVYWADHNQETLSSTPKSENPPADQPEDEGSGDSLWDAIG